MPIAPMPPAIPAPEPVQSTHLVLGLANPEWLHLGVEGRRGRLGYSLAAGTLVLAHDVTGTARYFLSDQTGGFFAEAGVTALRMAPISDQTPGDWFAMGMVGVGYQVVVGRMVTNLGIGLTPLPLPPSNNQPMFASNAAALPRVLLQAGFAL
ncbi:hypothetical protein D3C86_1353400 [compost metagenome]